MNANELGAQCVSLNMIVAGDAAPNEIISALSGHRSLTKRELFAAMAMQGLIAWPHRAPVSHDRIAEEATRLADAILAELAKDQP